MNPEQSHVEFAALGGTVHIHGYGVDSQASLDRAASIILELQERLTRFEDDSELSRLNRDPRTEVPASPLMLRFADAVGYAGTLSHGLVDATLLDEVQRAGYVDSLEPGMPGPASNRTAPEPAWETDEPRPAAGNWSSVGINLTSGAVCRPVGVKLDSGGLGKGMAADMAAEVLGHLDHFSVDCCGDLAFGGSNVGEREITVSSPFADEPPVASLNLRSGGLATSGTTKRSWHHDGGHTSHHLIDPRTGHPARTGLAQVTAHAPTALEAEIRTKAALLSGPDGAAEWLIYGGVTVAEDGAVDVVESSRTAGSHA